MNVSRVAMGTPERCQGTDMLYSIHVSHPQCHMQSLAGKEDTAILAVSDGLLQKLVLRKVPVTKVELRERGFDFQPSADASPRLTSNCRMILAWRGEG